MDFMKGKLFLVGLTVFVAACVTVNIYFPAAEVKQAAEDIVKDVRGQQPGDKGQLQDMEESPTSWLRLYGLAYAANELTVSNATIRQLKARMRQRYPGIVPYLKSGVAGEGADGLLKIRGLGGLGLRQKAEVKRIVSAENNDRMALYRSVAQSLNIPASQIARVQAIFAQEWQKTAPTGTFIEISPGNWKKKTN
jgi:uncharacterized protein YdbL (DUF1318 family)